FVAVLIFWTINARPAATVDEKDKLIIHLPPVRPPNIALPESDRRAGGGGGGGRGMILPATFGERDPFLNQDPLIAPTTRPQLKPPVLPTQEWLLGDPTHNVTRDALLPTGIPDGVTGPPSDGLGSGGGIGTGKKGGIGPGDGPGFGPGEKGGQGGKEFGPGGNNRRTRVVDQVDSKPILLNRPRPNYTEEARNEKLQGTVRAQVLVGEDGRVERVRVIRGLSAGLTEEAIQAASQMRFRPATKDGRPVAHWVTLEIEFNLR
ncbi:MAG: energy transducer TonB, partial [Blastocatellia bacterium]|nr:energy transducer TonB [Blastocatellia bacterium]